MILIDGAACADIDADDGIAGAVRAAEVANDVLGIECATIAEHGIIRGRS